MQTVIIVRKGLIVFINGTPLFNSMNTASLQRKMEKSCTKSKFSFIEQIKLRNIIIGLIKSTLLLVTYVTNSVEFW